MRRGADRGADDHHGPAQAFRYAEAPVMSTFKYSSILWAAGLGYVMLGDVLDATAALGAGMIVISGIAVVVYRNRETIDIDQINLLRW